VPGITAFDTLRALKTAKPDLQVLMLSGRGRPSTSSRPYGLAGGRLVVKPDDPEGSDEIASTPLSRLDREDKARAEITELRRSLARPGPRVYVLGAQPDMRTIAT